MRHSITVDWSIDVPPKHSRRDTDDGFKVFVYPDMQIWVVVYCELPLDPKSALESFLNWAPTCITEEFDFCHNLMGIEGSAYLMKEDDSWLLYTAVALNGMVVQIEFEFDEESLVKSAVNIWHSLTYTPPREASQ